ncbi:hypothetical protein Pfo_024634 [Paulownia fortunei]|nr:hypothetical protein Pfo_024634 [Paulownia fortunei]
MNVGNAHSDLHAAANSNLHAADISDHITGNDTANAYHNAGYVAANAAVLPADAMTDAQPAVVLPFDLAVAQPAVVLPTDLAAVLPTAAVLPAAQPAVVLSVAQPAAMPADLHAAFLLDALHATALTVAAQFVAVSAQQDVVMPAVMSTPQVAEVFAGIVAPRHATELTVCDEIFCSTNEIRVELSNQNSSINSYENMNSRELYTNEFSATSTIRDNAEDLKIKALHRTCHSKHQIPQSGQSKMTSKRKTQVSKLKAE